MVVRPYDSGSRTDVSEIIALSADYRIRDWLTVTALTTFVANQSNQSAFDYEVFNGGGGITLSWKFSDGIPPRRRGKTLRRGILSPDDA